MSRILRRPMFRGGRVDSRGTGITSGLSYAKGGSVNIPKRGLVDGPGGYAGEYGIFSQQVQPKDYRQKQQFYQQEYKPLYPTFKSIADAYNKAVKNEEANIDAMEIEQLFPASDTKRYDDLYDLTSPGGKAEFFQEKRNEEKARLDEAANYGVDLTTQLEQAIKKDTPVANVNTNTGTGNNDNNPVDPTASIKENRELFAELLGAKKARGQDISDMLLSFAGKALKDDATVKSAFGEFAEAEATRPSRRRKIDDTAAAMAINAYIAGEKSIADTKKALDLYEKKLSRASSAEDSKTITTRMNEDKGTQRSDLKKLIGNTAEYMEDNNIPGVPQQIKKEQAEDPGLLVEENVGAVFIDTDSKKVFIIIKDSNGKPIKRPLYSG